MQWLQAHEIDWIEKPIRETPPTLEELRKMLATQQGEVRRLFNTSGLEYRALGLARKLPELTTEGALRLLAGNGNLVKRPFLIARGVALIGFDAAVWARALSWNSRKSGWGTKIM